MHVMVFPSIFEISSQFIVAVLFFVSLSYVVATIFFAQDCRPKHYVKSMTFQSQRYKRDALKPFLIILACNEF